MLTEAGASSPGLATTWLLQLSHLKVGARGTPSYMPSHNKKVRLCAAAHCQGRDAAAAASSRGGGIPVVAVTMGDQNLTAEDIRASHIYQATVRHGYWLKSNEGIVDANGRLHQDLIFVDKNWDCTLHDLPSAEVRVGFDGVHQSVRALLSRPRPRPGGASTPAASASSAAPAMLALSPPPPPEPPAPSVAASVASTADEAPAAAARPAPASPAASVTEAPVAAPTRPMPQVAVDAVPAAAAASTRGVFAVDSRGIPASDSWEPDWGDADEKPPLNAALRTGKDVVAGLDRHTLEEADVAEADEALADALAEAAAQAEPSSGSGGPAQQVKTEAEPGSDAVPAAACGERRVTMRSRIIVDNADEKFFLVRSADDTKSTKCCMRGKERLRTRRVSTSVPRRLKMPGMP